MKPIILFLTLGIGSLGSVLAQPFAAEIKNGNVEMIRAYAAKNGNLNRLEQVEISTKQCVFKGNAHYLEIAALANKPQMVNVLLEYKTKLDSIEWQVNQAYLAALANGNVVMAKTLYNENADANQLFTRCENKAALELAIVSKKKELTEMVISKSYQHWGLANADGITPMHLAAEQGDLDLIKVIMSHNVEVNSVDNDGLTPLLLAFLNNHVYVAEYLVKFAGPVVNRVDPTGNTALCYAAKYGMEKTAATLVEKGARVDCKCSEFNSALEMAMRQKATSTVRAMLIKAEGTNIKRPNYYLKVANKMGMPEDILVKINELR